MFLPSMTVDNLELFNTMRRTRKSHGSLFGVIDRTRSRSGRRLLRDWLARPLIDAEQIQSRLNAIEFLIRENDIFASLEKIFANSLDVEMILVSALRRKISPRDFVRCVGAMSKVGDVVNSVQRDFCCRDDLMRRILDDVELAFDGVETLLSNVNTKNDVEIEVQYK